MSGFRLFILIGLLSALVPAPAGMAPAPAAAPPPADKGEVVGAKLCQRPQGLVYLLTLLARDGKVTRVAVDASSGRLAGGR